MMRVCLSSVLATALLACLSDAAGEADASASEGEIEADAASEVGVEAEVVPEPVPVVFFYQDVAPSGNKVRVGRTRDGVAVERFDVDAAKWSPIGASEVFGDPTWSRLANGRWAMVANTGHDDPRGAMALQIFEADCPRGVPEPGAVKAVVAVARAGCRASATTAMAKSSQLFAGPDGLGHFMFIGNMGGVWLVRVSDDDDGGGADLEGVCLREDDVGAVGALGALAVGDAVEVLPRDVAGATGDDGALGPLLLSDAAIARRADGTWVLFVKGVAASLGCAGGGLCELCARGIYRTTSRDLLAWSPLERVAYRASVPDATSVGGEVWLAYQDFAPACAAEDLQLAARAPIQLAREDASGQLGAPRAVVFDEPFESDVRLHYPTNGNPVALPDAAAWRALEACMAP